ncbi:MAG: LAGLIDADG family homing endonuclease [bacterium]|nr:LAGLIDADG family homing endonuclease [bacterium]
MRETDRLSYPKKSHRKVVNFPNESAKLAELMGIVAGDGGINNKWQLVISLNSDLDKHYSVFIVGLMKDLFFVDVSVLKRIGEKTLRIICSSSNLVDFLVGKGAVRGDKIKHRLTIPEWINGNIEYEKAFVRGLVDTDGCLYIHRHKVGGKLQYNIGFCFTSLAEGIIKAVEKILKSINIQPHIADKGRRIYLYSHKSVKKYLELIGTSNDRIMSIYLKWLKHKTGEVA